MGGARGPVFRKGGGKGCSRSGLEGCDDADTENSETRESRLEGLPPLPVLQAGACAAAWARGPHDTCNYLLPGCLLAGSYPGDRSEPGHSEKILACLEAGVDTFLCLQQRRELERFTPYVARAAELRAALPGAEGRELEFLHCEVPDGHVTSRHHLAIAVATVVQKLREGRKVYVHCWGGHGRTGTLLCAFLVKAYGLTTEEAKDYFMLTHSQRRVRGGGGPGFWPHSQEQYQQVQSFEDEGPELLDEFLGPLEEW